MNQKFFKTLFFLSYLILKPIHPPLVLMSSIIFFMWDIWCTTVQYSILLTLEVQYTYDIFTSLYKQDYYLWTLLEWFSPLSWWRRELKKAIDFSYQRGYSLYQIKKKTTIAIVHKPYFQNTNKVLWSRDEAYMWHTFDDYPLEQSFKAQLTQHMLEINGYHPTTPDPAQASSS